LPDAWRRSESRASHALATHALTDRPDFVLSIYDSRTGSFQAVEPAWAAQLVGWDDRSGRRLPVVPAKLAVVGQLSQFFEAVLA
jgi:hypothetical protein